MIVLNVTYKCKPELREEFLEAILREGIDIDCRAEAGNVKYEYYLPFDGSGDELLLVEKWRDADALALHFKQPHYQRLMQLKEQYVLETTVDRLSPKQ